METVRFFKGPLQPPLPAAPSRKVLNTAAHSPSRTAHEVATSTLKRVVLTAVTRSGASDCRAVSGRTPPISGDTRRLCLSRRVRSDQASLRGATISISSQMRSSSDRGARRTCIYLELRYEDYQKSNAAKWGAKDEAHR